MRFLSAGKISQQARGDCFFLTCQIKMCWPAADFLLQTYSQASYNYSTSLAKWLAHSNSPAEQRHEGWVGNA